MSASAHSRRQPATEPARPLYQVFAGLRGQFLSAAEDFKDFTVLVVKRSDVTSPRRLISGGFRAGGRSLSTTSAPKSGCPAGEGNASR
jgi:hypothetical protein